MSEVTIYHNPRCSKSRQTLALLTSRGITPRVVHYLDTPPDATTLKRLLKLLGMKSATAAARAGSHRTCGIRTRRFRSCTDDELIAAMVSHPVLIERPIVEADGRAAIGRPPENVLQIV